VAAGVARARAARQGPVLAKPAFETSLAWFFASGSRKVQGRKILLAKSTAICQVFVRQKLDKNRRPPRCDPSRQKPSGGYPASGTTGES